MFVKAPWCVCKDDTSDSLSKVKSTIWLPRFLILKPLLDHHIGVKVAAMTSVFKALLVRSLATIMEIEVAISSCSRNLGPSFWEMVSLDHCFVRSSMEDISVSHNPKKKKKTNEP